MAVTDLDSRRFSFLGLNFHNYTQEEAVERLEDFIKSQAPHRVSTVTAELVVRSRNDEALRQFYNNADLLTVDSFVVYYAAKLFRKPIKEPVNAIRLALKFLDLAERKGYRIYLLGAEKAVVARTAEILANQHPGLNIVGWHDGYFDFENDQDVVANIKDRRPDIIFIAMSSPLKEDFIRKNFNILGIPAFMPVGGGFDVIAGRCRFAPLWISKIGLEWLYRFIQEPGRMWKRYTLVNITFLCLLVKELFKKAKPIVVE